MRAGASENSALDSEQTLVAGMSCSLEATFAWQLQTIYGDLP